RHTCHADLSRHGFSVGGSTSCLGSAKTLCADFTGDRSSGGCVSRKHTLLPREYPDRYCLSYADTFLNCLPCSSVPFAVTVRDLPSAATTMRPVAIVLSPLFTGNFNLCESIFLYERISDVESPVTA